MTSPSLPTLAPVTDVLADLDWRGLVAQTTDRAALAEDLADGPLTVYCGFDPTADSLHLGNLVPLFALRRFQLAGHRPVALAGGATGFIGDPTGRTEGRVMMTQEVIAARVLRIREQLERFLVLDGEAGLHADNLEWTGAMSALDFLRDVGKHFPVSQMLARESVSARLASGGLSFTELSYQLLQSNDYVELYRRHGCRLQVGGNDQWGNITAGLDLLRRVEGHEVSAHALTFPLVTDSAGAKLGKSTGGGAVWVDRAMTSPYAMYQFALGVDDADAGTYLRLLTFVGQEEVEALDVATAERPQARAAQRRLAQELVALLHGPDEVAKVEAASAALFGTGDLRALDADTLAAALAEAPSVRVEGATPPFVELLSDALGLSRSDARRAVKEGSASLNGVKVTDEALVPADDDWLHGRFLVLKRGKRATAVAERT
ncbi:MAG: tyrosine--tRNA ligase [Frankiales bacterium]|nr:tyrosine--tRNA ligase [Frankiales bacterium]